MESFNLNASVNEYVFARIIEDYNENALQDKKPLITATQGRKLHQDLERRLSEIPQKDGTGYRMETAVRSVFLDAVNQTLEPVVGEPIVERTGESYKNVYGNYTQEYFARLGWDLSGPGADRRRQFGEVKPGGYLPVSPFSTKFAHRGTVLSHGTEILYANADDMLTFIPNEAGTGYVPMYAQDDLKEQNLSFYTMHTTNQGVSYFKECGPVCGQDDVTGLSRIRAYMSESDYRSVSPWMNIPMSERMSQEGVERSAAILQMLQEHGIEYKVVKDKYPGQLKVSISNTKIDVRLTDTRPNEQFLGRIYKDGYSLFIGANEKPPMHQPTIPEMNALILYAIGEHPDRLNNRSSLVGKKIGSPSGYRSRRDGQMVRSTFTSVNSKTNRLTLHAMMGYSNDGKMLSIHTQNSHSQSHRIFQTNEEAETFLQEAVSSARDAFAKAVNVDYLLQEAEAHAGEEDYVPVFSGDASIAPIQQTYWEVLTGKSELYRPENLTENDTFRAMFDALGLLEPDTTEELDVDTVKLENGTELYAGTSAENVKAHLQESMDLLFGNYTPDEMGVRFNPAMVSSFMDSSFGIYRNNDNLVAAMYKLEFDGSEVRGTDFQSGLIKDRLLRFDEASARPMVELDTPFMQSIYATIKDSITETACSVKDEDIRIDKNGVVRYKAEQMFGKGKDVRIVEGQLGQIFEPDKQGVVETHYNGSANKLFSPGYDAYIVPETPETAGQDLMTRVRLRGMEQIMKQNISETLRYDLMGEGERILDDAGQEVGKIVGMTTSVNNTYRGLYSTMYNVRIEPLEGESLKDTYIRQAELTHLPKDILDARFETAKGLMHFSKDIAENSTVSADYFHKMRSDMSSVHEVTNDNFQDAYELTGRSNMAITQNHSEGYTDPVLTGSGKNQGVVRYLVTGASVTPEGVIVPSEDKTARAPLMTTEPMRYRDYIPADRVQMVGSNYLTASGVAGLNTRQLSDGEEAKGVGMAQLTLQGFTFDDGAVISSDFAEEYGVVNEDGTTRPLKPGDKICDFAGNKSIVAKVIDRNMDMEEAREIGVDVAVQLFRDNPDLDVVQAPYSAVSRFNAASSKLLMEHTQDLKLPDGTTKEGCIGFAPVIITHHTAHEHTKQYDEDDVQAGKGRKVSAQLAWAFSAKGATHLMDEAFSGNNSAVSNFREVLNVMGLDMDETGTLRKTYAPHESEERFVFQLPDADTIANTPDKEISDLFRESVDSRGGFLEIPFPMELPSGMQTQPVPADKSAYPDRVMYALPVLSSHMRSGQSFEDGTSMTHDYTNQYVRVFESAVKYLKAEQKGSQSEMRAAMDMAKTSYSSITESLRTRKFDTKHNAMRDDFMSHRMAHSATAVWTPDSHLALDEIAMSSSMAKTLGLKVDGDRTMLWRDPILRDYGTKYMRIKIDDSLTGIAVNPLTAQMFDGDFDGDSAGLWAPSRTLSKEECMELFSIENNMLDTTKVRENGDFALIFNTSMDVVSAEVADEKRRDAAIANGEDYGLTLKERRLALEHEANEIYKSDMSPAEKMIANREVLDKLSDWAKDTLCPTCGTEVVSYKDLESHAQSLIDMVDHGAKGSHKKLMSYFKYFGADFEVDDAGHIKADSMKDIGHTLATPDDVADTELATAIKSHGTGNAGAVSQRVVTVARNRGVIDKSDPENVGKENALAAALKTTYLSTQGLLQAKHDPVQAQRLYEMVQGPVRNIWRGRSMEAKEIVDANGDARTTWMVRKGQDASGNMVPVQASKEEWVQSFMEIHEHKDGMDLAGSINIDHVRQVADALFDEKTGTMFDIEDAAVIEEIAAPMDILAYRTKDAFETICKMAENRRNIFEGTYNQMFAPKQVRDNMKALETGDPMKPITSRDVQVDFDPAKKAKTPIEVKTVDAAYGKSVKEASLFVDESPSPVMEQAVTKEPAVSSVKVDYSKSSESVAASVTPEMSVSARKVPDISDMDKTPDTHSPSL